MGARKSAHMTSAATPAPAPAATASEPERRVVDSGSRRLPASASVISIRAAAAESSRCLLSFSRHLFRSLRIVDGVSAGRAFQSGSRSRIAAAVSDGVSRPKADRLVSIS